MPRFQKIPRANWSHAREMRRRPTAAEHALWKALRARQIGTDFRRQHPIGPYVADFYSRQCKLIVEVDGDSHAKVDQVKHDEKREAYFTLQGIQVKRYANRDVLTNLDGVLRDILMAIDGKCERE